MTIDCSGNPKRMVEDISAVGLRHAGYAIPTEFMAPLVSDAVEVVRTMMTDKNAEDRLRWSLTLISKILGRTILETYAGWLRNNAGGPGDFETAWWRFPLTLLSRPDSRGLPSGSSLGSLE